MPNLTRAQILARKTGRSTVELADGTTVAIRALTRDEVIAMDEYQTVVEKNNYLVATALTDPVLSIDDVAVWGAEGASGDLDIISAAVHELSRTGTGAGKSGVPGTGKRSRAGSGIRGGDVPADDRGPAEG